MHKNRYLALFAALALVLGLAVPVTAYATEGDGPSHYSVSDDSPDPERRHGDDCVRDVKLGGKVVQVRPADGDWPGHMDGACYKTGLDAAPSEDGEDDDAGNGDVTGSGGVDEGAGAGEDSEEVPDSVYKPMLGVGSVFVKNLEDVTIGASGSTPSEKELGDEEGGLVVNVDSVPFEDWGEPKREPLPDMDFGMFADFGNQIRFEEDFNTSYYGNIYQENVNDVLHGKSQDRTPGIDHVYLENHFATQSGHVSERLKADGTRDFTVNPDGSLTIPMRVKWVMRGGYRANGICVLNINVGFYNEYKEDKKDTTTSLWGTDYGLTDNNDISKAIDVQIVPTQIRTDNNQWKIVGEDIDMDPVWIKANKTCSGNGILYKGRSLNENEKALCLWGNTGWSGSPNPDNYWGYDGVYTIDESWQTAELEFDLVIHPKEGSGHTFENYGGADPYKNIINTVASAPINWFMLDPGDQSLAQGHGAVQDDTIDPEGEYSLFGDRGIGKATITKTFSPVYEGKGFADILSDGDFSFMDDIAYGPVYPWAYEWLPNAERATPKDFSSPDYPWNSTTFRMTCTWTPDSTGDPDKDTVKLDLTAGNKTAIRNSGSTADPEIDWTIEACSLEFDRNFESGAGSITGGDWGNEAGTSRTVYHRPAVTTASDALDRTFSLSSITAIRDGWEFVGWSTDPEGTGIQDGDTFTLAGGEYTDVLYAQWEQSVNFDPLPDTGGAGTGLWLLAGMAGLMTAAIVLSMARKRESM